MPPEWTMTPDDVLDYINGIAMGVFAGVGSSFVMMQGFNVLFAMFFGSLYVCHAMIGIDARKKLEEKER